MRTDCRNVLEDNRFATHLLSLLGSTTKIAIIVNDGALIPAILNSHQHPNGRLFIEV